MIGKTGLGLCEQEHEICQHWIDEMPPDSNAILARPRGKKKPDFAIINAFVEQFEREEENLT